MNPRNSRNAQCFFGTIEQCVEHYGGKSLFTVSASLTLFSGARLETYRRAQSNDGTVFIVERQLESTTCEVYLRPAAIRPQSASVTTVPRSNCA